MYPNAAKTVFILFMILVPILLLNMLIAMMGNTYSQVIERSEKEWVKQVHERLGNIIRYLSSFSSRRFPVVCTSKNFINIITIISLQNSGRKLWSTWKEQ